jgi:hypothetical protein
MGLEKLQDGSTTLLYPTQHDGTPYGVQVVNMAPKVLRARTQRAQSLGPADVTSAAIGCILVMQSVQEPCR